MEARNLAHCFLTLRAVLAAGFFACVCATAQAQPTGPSIAQSEPETVDVAAALCRDVLVLSGEDRDLGIAFMHGHIFGEKGQSVIYPDQLAQSVGVFLELCVEDPQANALATLKKSIAQP